MQAAPTDAEPAFWRLDTPLQTLVLASWQSRLPCVIYWGTPLAESEDVAALASALARPLSNGTLDHVADLSICPEEGRGFAGQPGLRVTDESGRPVLTQFRLDSVKAEADRLIVEATDGPGALIYRATFKAGQTGGVIEAEAHLTASDRKVRVDWLAAPVVPVPETADHLIEFAGRWTLEFGVREIPFTRGIHMRESRRGRTGQDHFPAVIAAQPGCVNTAGEARAVHFGFSGAHRMVAEELADGRRQIQTGVPETAILAAGETLCSQTAFLALTSEGLNGIAGAFQGHVRSSIVAFPDPDRPRPVHYNCWEAVYFDHRVDDLKDLATRAADLGAERFVLDDGWFGSKRQGRDDDTTSLGDWTVDARKYPDGLTPLIDHVRDLGMTFGLWVEPEMINLDSDLARAHPDWIIAPEGREQMTGRGQHVLDFSNPAVTEHIFARLDALLGENEIDYFKWDMNRDLTLAVDRDGFGLLRRQIEAVYALMDRLHEAHPDVEIESCASGGARIDYGILRRTQRVWLSDSNDAHERWKMQHQAMLFLPPEIVGSHVGPRHCHTSGRILPMRFRAAVAASGHMGFEMDLRELDEEETATLKRYTNFYRDNRVWLHGARQHRLEPAGDETLAHISVDPTRERFLVFSATLKTLPNETAAPLCLAGLDPDSRYRVTLWNRDEIERPPTRRFVSALTSPDGIVLSGAALMRSGIVLPLAFPDRMWILQGTRIAGKDGPAQAGYEGAS